MTVPRPTAIPRFPPKTAERIMRFLATGYSGTIEIHVHDGRIRGGRIIEAFRDDDPEPTDPAPFPRRRLDETATVGHDSGI